MSPSDAMPITTVTKMTGAVTVLMSCRNASASHFASVAGPGATNPKITPAAIATSTQNHSCRFTATPLSLPADGAKVRPLRTAVSLVVVVVVENVVNAEPRRAPADPPVDRRRGHGGGGRPDHGPGRPRAHRDRGARPVAGGRAHRGRAARGPAAEPRAAAARRAPA